MSAWLGLSKLFPGWTLEELKALSPRERLNWIEMSREYQALLRKQANG
jgi:hypothetical protein